MRRLGYRLHDRVVRIGPQTAEEVCPLHSVKIASVSHRASCAMVTECSVPGVKRSVPESNPNISQVAKLIKRGAPSAVGTE